MMPRFAGASVPPLRTLFRGNMEEPGGTLTDMIAVAVDGLDPLDEIVPEVRNPGIRHAGYGMIDADYDPAGTALLWTLEQGPGDAFTAETREAWAAVYGILATTLKDAAAAA